MIYLLHMVIVNSKLWKITREYSNFDEIWPFPYESREEPGLMIFQWNMFRQFCGKGPTKTSSDAFKASLPAMGDSRCWKKWLEMDEWMDLVMEYMECTKGYD